MTKEERRLWYECLKLLPVTVNQQKVIGRYIVDFYCASAKVVIELDGSQHFGDAALAADRERDAYLRSLGLTVLRYTNLEVNRKFKEVCEDVYRHLMQLSTSSSLRRELLPVAIIDCSPLWLKTCHWHVFLTRRASRGSQGVATDCQFFCTSVQPQSLPLEGKVAER